MGLTHGGPRLLAGTGRHGAKSPPTSTTTIPQLENPPTDQATTTIPLRQETPRLDDNLPLERQRAYREVTRRQIELAGGQAATAAGPSEPLRHEPPTEERILTMDYAATQARSLWPLLPPHS
jgi:hypothetical protein